MEHAICLRKEIDPNMEGSYEHLNSSHEEEPPFLLGFPSPFLDDISTIPKLTKNHHPKSSNKPLTITTPTPVTNSESKRLKRRSNGKKDRHSKIHTAQGLRDRRMRLSLHIARKFFDLQDLLGFDKASKTIEWLFCKSNKAIKEVAENFIPQQANQTMSEEIEATDSLLSESEVVLTNKLEDSKIANTNESRKRVRNNSLARDQARARARKRTRERLMIKEFKRSKCLLGGNPINEIYKLGLGCYSGSPSNHNIEELGYANSSPSEPIQQESLSEHSNTTHHLLRELQMATINVECFEDFSGNIAGASTYDTTLISQNPPAGWPNSSNGFLGIQGEWDISETCNYGIVPSAAITDHDLTGDIYDQNPNSFFMSSTTNILHF